MSKGAGLGDTRIRSRNGRQTRRMSGIVLRKLQTRAPWDPGVLGRGSPVAATRVRAPGFPSENLPFSDKKGAGLPVSSLTALGTQL